MKPVPREHIDAVRPLVSRQVWAFIQLQIRTAARPGEVVLMRAIDLDTSGKIWIYQPQQHKTRHHGHSRLIYVGPRAQKLLRPFIADRAFDAYLFSPREAEEERRKVLYAKRKTSHSCGNRPGTNRRSRPQKEPGEHYTTMTYRRAISRACNAAKVPSWHPHQLRHNAATHLRKEFGLEVARIILGHRSPVVTEIYAEMDAEMAIEVMSKIG